MCSCGQAKVRKFVPVDAFLVRCTTCTEAAPDLLGNPQPIHLISILSNRETIRYWFYTLGLPIEFLTEDQRALVLLDAA